MEGKITQIKATGITRPVDKAGRVVLPKDLRERYDIAPDDQVEVYSTTEGILIKKYTPSCEFCGGYDSNMKMFMGKKICTKCISTIKEEL
jgi:looped-hinge helix DNA binding domain, AbrB family